MISVSKDFKLAMKQPVKELQGYIKVDDISITDEDNLISFKLTCNSAMCKTAMRKLEVKYLGNANLLGKWINVGYGVKLADLTYEYIDYGSFLVNEITYSKDTDTTTLVAYDSMIKSMVPYTKVDVSYPISLYDYTKYLCQKCGLTLGNDELPVMNSFIINKELYENINGITYRDVLVQIAQCTASTCIIGNDNKLYFKRNLVTNETLSYDNMFSLKLEEKYGPINSVVLSRTPAEDNIYRRDENDIEANGLTEIKIENNEIIDKERDMAMIFLYPAYKGITYYPFEVTTEGLGYFEIGDTINILTDKEEIYTTTIFEISILLDGALKETLKTTAQTKTQTQYQYASTIAKKLKNTEIIVDKQQQYIQGIVTDIYEDNGVVNEGFSKVYQDIQNVVTTIQSTGRDNLIKNSVMFAHDSENIPEWEINGDGTIHISTNTESLNVGAISGHGFMLNNKHASQKVIVQKNESNGSDNIYYTFSTRIKKDIAGNCYVKIYNNIETYLIEVNMGDKVYYKEYSITLYPKDSYYIIEFYGSEDSDVIFTDNMLNVGKFKTKWTQAQGEVMNTQVNINVDGLLVKSSVYEGDYTVMSPVEFSGYSKINGVITRVFSLNKDTTNIRKVLIDKELTMPPIKIIPISSGDIKGWAFVPTTQE